MHRVGHVHGRLLVLYQRCEVLINVLFACPAVEV